MCQNCKQNVNCKVNIAMHCNNGSEHLHSCLVCSMLHIVKSSLCSSRLLLLYALSSFWRQTSWIYCLQSLLSGIQFKLQILFFFSSNMIFSASFSFFKYALSAEIQIPIKIFASHYLSDNQAPALYLIRYE